MSLRVTSIASGSSGNALLVQAGETSVLVDAGITAKRLVSELKDLGVNPSDLKAIFLTHEHGDHIAGAGVLSRRYRVPVVANEQTLLGSDLGRAELQVSSTGGVTKVDGLTVTSFGLPHDGVEPVGYLLEWDRWKICVATDLGYAPESINEFVRASDLIVLESNHDVDRLVKGPYPSSLKSRILGYTGHLSNQQASECVSASVSGRPQWLWLAHLSDINNSPACALRSVRKHLQQSGIDSIHVSVALRDRRSLTWDAGDCWVQPRLT